ncbi:hypothetical protein CVT24_003858 [Panaeolus cyanescens]|uniref:cAMP-independent regulatory protein pac2 n=1 Tax=Panaeolus cyanescens TaxID=181874 RepID=A0A409W894_9AGAR|nr:hypothetical protein CVT24_003858 [Panaeolus cyanescens]
MQQPTCTGIRIRSTQDAHKIFRAIQQGYLHMVTRRLDADERAALRSGCVYAWEERGPHSEITGLGIERFTEGRRWSPSRVRDEFLFYYEKYSPPPDASNLGNPSDRQPPRDWDPLVKQTYSVWVETEKGRRKWHLTAYFTQATIDQLGTIDDIPRVRDVVITDGMFTSTRVAKPPKSNRDDPKSDKPTSTVVRTYAPFPASYQYHQRHNSPSSTPVLMHEPYQTSSTQTYDSTPSLSATPPPPPPQNSYRPTQAHTSSSQSPTPYVASSHTTSTGTLPPPLSAASQYQQQTPRSVNSSQTYYSSSNTSGTWSSSNDTFYRPQDPHYSYSVSVQQPAPAGTAYQESSGPPSVPYHYLNGALHSVVMDDGRALSPLHIPERTSHLPQVYHPVQQHISPHTQLDELEPPSCALVPLNTLRQPSRIFPREPCDEKTLRRLRVPGQASP